MTVSLQVIYPISDDTHFDYDYYAATHMQLVGEHMGAHIDSTLVTKGIAGGPDTPPGSYAVATILFKDQGALDAAMAVAGPVLGSGPIDLEDSQAV
jgi:uncharacterized protein (TIGR02118 family)